MIYSDLGGNLTDKLRKSCVNAKYFTVDVSDLSGVMQMKMQVEDSMGASNIIVDAAVVQYQPWTSVLQQPTEDYESQFRSRLMHSVNMVKAFVPAMQKKAGNGLSESIQSALCNVFQDSLLISLLFKFDLKTLIKMVSVFCSRRKQYTQQKK